MFLYPVQANALCYCLHFKYAVGYCLLALQSNINSKHGAFTQCCFNVVPPSSTLAQHWNSIGWMPRLCWDKYITVGEVIPNHVWADVAVSTFRWPWIVWGGLGDTAVSPLSRLVPGSGQGAGRASHHPRRTLWWRQHYRGCPADVNGEEKRGCWSLWCDSTSATSGGIIVSVAGLPGLACRRGKAWKTSRDILSRGVSPLLFYTPWQLLHLLRRQGVLIVVSKLTCTQ